MCSTQNRSALVRELLSNSSLFVGQLYKAKLLVCCKRHFIKIPFVDKGIELIDSHSNFKENLVISSFQITLIILKLLSFVINITNQLGLLFSTLIKL